MLSKHTNDLDRLLQDNDLAKILRKTKSRRNETETEVKENDEDGQMTDSMFQFPEAKPNRKPPEKKPQQKPEIV